MPFGVVTFGPPQWLTRSSVTSGAKICAQNLRKSLELARYRQKLAESVSRQSSCSEERKREKLSFGFARGTPSRWFTPAFSHSLAWQLAFLTEAKSAVSVVSDRYGAFSPQKEKDAWRGQDTGQSTSRRGRGALTGQIQDGHCQDWQDCLEFKRMEKDSKPRLVDIMMDSRNFRPHLVSAPNDGSPEVHVAAGGGNQRKAPLGKRMVRDEEDEKCREVMLLRGEVKRIREDSRLAAERSQKSTVESKIVGAIDAKKTVTCHGPWHERLVAPEKPRRARQDSRKAVPEEEACCAAAQPKSGGVRERDATCIRVHDVSPWLGRVGRQKRIRDFLCRSRKWMSDQLEKDVRRLEEVTCTDTRSSAYNLRLGIGNTRGGLFVSPFTSRTEDTMGRPRDHDMTAEENPLDRLTGEDFHAFTSKGACGAAQPNTTGGDWERDFTGIHVHGGFPSSGRSTSPCSPEPGSREGQGDDRESGAGLLQDEDYDADHSDMEGEEEDDYDADGSDVESGRPREDDRCPRTQPVGPSKGKQPCLQEEKRSCSQRVYGRVEDDVGRYEIHGSLGSGASGRTYLARHKDSSEFVALKLYSLRKLSCYEAMDFEEFDSEQATTKIYELWLECNLLETLQSNGQSPFINYLAHGQPLICDMQRGLVGFPRTLGHGCLYQFWYRLSKLLPGDIPEDVAMFRVFIAAQVADAVRFLHAHGVAHGDIRTTNILIAPDGYVQLTDFGDAFYDVSKFGLGRLHVNLLQANTRRSQLGFIEAAPPEDIWTNGKPSGSVGDIQRGCHGDLHMFGAALFGLDWPPPKDFYLPLSYDTSAPSFSCFADSFRIDFEPRGISGAMREYILALTESRPTQRLGYGDPAELIRHHVFEAIDFDMLRKQTLVSPLVSVGPERLFPDDVQENASLHFVSFKTPAAMPERGGVAIEHREAKYNASVTHVEKEHFWRVFTACFTNEAHASHSSGPSGSLPDDNRDGAGSSLPDLVSESASSDSCDDSSIGRNDDSAANDSGDGSMDQSGGDSGDDSADGSTGGSDDSADDSGDGSADESGDDFADGSGDSSDGSSLYMDCDSDGDSSDDDNPTIGENEGTSVTTL